MKKGKLLSSELSYAIARMGHTQTIVIGDSGLPAPPGVKRIDLAVTNGVPGFLQVLDAVLTELQVERIVLAEEILAHNPDTNEAVQRRLGGVPAEYVPHEDFKEQTKNACCIVRTGEMAPYANVILQSGVTF